MSITRDFKLSLVAGRSVPLVINANQYDDGEIWRFTLLDENGQKYSPSTGSIIGLKSDGHIITNAGTVSSTGLVIIAETEQMTAAVGKNFYELLIDDDTHGTANFIVFVEPRPGADGTPSDSDLAVFQEAIDAAATIGDVVDLVDDVAVLEARMDEFTTLTDGSTTGDAELADIRVGADGTTYPNAGDAVRGQVSDLKTHISQIIDGTGEVYKLTWVSGYTINANPDTGSFNIEPYAGRRYAGPFTTINDFIVLPNVNNISIIATDDTGQTTLNTGWTNSKTNILKSYGTYFYILCSFDNDANVPYVYTDGAVLNINYFGDGVTNTLKKNVFTFSRGQLSDSGTITDSELAMVMDNIISLPFNLTIPVNSLSRIKVLTYDDAEGTNPVNHGYVNQVTEYNIPANTYFRLGVFYRTDVQGIKVTDKAGMFDSELYQSLVFYAGGYAHYNLMNNIETTLTKTRYIPVNENTNVINHRGYNLVFPENTMIAFKNSRIRGFNIVETDVRFTSDNVAVCLHDETIDRTSNGSGNIADMTYAQALTYDFGSWKNAAYAGEHIPTFSQFITFCKRSGMKAYVELKVGTQAQIESLVNMVIKAGMRKNISWISYHQNLLMFVKNADPYARLGHINNVITADIVNQYTLPLKTETNEIFLDTDYTNITDGIVNICVENNIPLEAFTVDSTLELESLNEYITGITTDYIIIDEYMFNSVID